MGAPGQLFAEQNAKRYIRLNVNAHRARYTLPNRVVVGHQTIVRRLSADPTVCSQKKWFGVFSAQNDLARHGVVSLVKAI